MLARAGLIAVLLLPYAAAAEQGKIVMTFGLGLSSCATWLANPTSKSAGDDWILGFWSGANLATMQNIGGTTDAPGLLGEVELICRKSPSVLLVTAAFQARNNMAQAGR